MRTLLIFIALALIVMVGKQLLRKPRSRGRTQNPPGKMVQCANCGIFVPENEAIGQDGRFYCSRQHLDAMQDRS